MLTESFVASISRISKTNTQVPKDAGIFVQELQPLQAQRHVFKKSQTAPNCLAVSETHVFAAQAGKAVVHVYNREKGNHEATVPFQERIGCLALACRGTVLVMGTEGGSIILWEISTGRQITVPQAHLQPVTHLTISPSFTHLLSGSADSNIHVWSLPSLLSFSSTREAKTPLQTLSHHRGPITALTLGHSSSTSANIAVSASTDSTALIWDYRTGALRRIYLLPSTPLALAFDVLDRALFATYGDGSVQCIDFYDRDSQPSTINPLYDTDPAASSTPHQPPPSSKWPTHSQTNGPALSIALSYDSSLLLTGHESGRIVAWDVGRGAFRDVVATLPGPVTNLV
ncbi:hypothetical protein LTS18_001275, partial [Coniosporium uncinatum]